MAAEISRELRDFTMAADLLKFFPFPENHVDAVNFIHELVRRKDFTVQQLRF